MILDHRKFTRHQSAILELLKMALASKKSIRIMLNLGSMGTGHLEREPLKRFEISLLPAQTGNQVLAGK